MNPINQQEIFTKSCINHLEHINGDTFNQFKKQIAFTGVELPLIDLFIQVQTQIKDDLLEGSEESIQASRIKVLDRNNLRVPIMNYLKARADHRPIGPWGNPSQLKNLLISVDVLYRMNVSDDINKDRYIRDWLNDAIQLEVSDPVKADLIDLKLAVEKRDKKMYEKLISKLQSYLEKK